MKYSKESRLVIKKYYSRFNKSASYYIVMSLIILIGLVFNPFGEVVFNVFDKGPFVVCPYIMLTLMFFVCLLYKNVLLYIFTIGLFILSFILSYVGVGMGSEYNHEVVNFFTPILLLFLLNIIIAILTHRYK